MNRTLIIAEAGVNHNGSLKTAKELVDLAYESGADIVKFQTAKLESLVSRNAPMAAYQKKNTGVDESQKAMYEELYKAFDDCDVMLTMEFNNDKSFKFAVDDESAKSAIEKIKENMKTAIPNAFKAMGMSDEVFEKYLKSQNKTVEDLVNQFTEEFSVDQLTKGVGASGNYELEDNKLFLFSGDGRIRTHGPLQAHWFSRPAP